MEEEEGFVFDETAFEVGKEEEDLPEPHSVVLVMGLDESGKSALINSMIYGEILNPMATELRESTRYCHNGVNFVMREIGGRFRFRDDWEGQYENAKALIWVIDGIDRGRIIESREEFDKVIVNEKLSSIPLLVVVNKQDARLKMDFEFVMARMELERFTDRKIKIIKTSKKACFELVEAMQWIVDELRLEPAPAPVE